MKTHSADTIDAPALHTPAPVEQVAPLAPAPSGPALLPPAAALCPTLLPATATSMLVAGAVLLCAALLCGAALLVVLRRHKCYGSTPEEREASMPGDELLQGGPPARTRMTRAVSIDAPPGVVWQWLAQLGRGAGWYSVERLDNGGKTSARHIVSWIPEPQVGDATAVGYLRHLEPESRLIWWMGGDRWLGSAVRMVVDAHLRGEGADASRLVLRISADAGGLLARPALWLFETIDTIMAVRQLRGIKERVESHAARPCDPDRLETGARDQYQLFEVIYASGESAGVPGREKASRWRENAIRDGVLKLSSDTPRPPANAGADARGADARGTDARGTDARGTDAQGTAAQGVVGSGGVGRGRRGGRQCRGS